MKKFRAWDTWTNKVVTDGLYLTLSGSLLEPERGSGLDDADNDRYVLMQFTGLKDSKGVEIYEGDVVKGEWFSALSNDCKGAWESIGEPCQVIFNSKRARFGLEGWDSYVLNQDVGAFEVIGNVWENPTLI